MTIAGGANTTMAARPRALLFDWDSTLVDNWRCIELAINNTLVAMGQAAWSAEEARRRIRESTRDAFPRLFGDRWPEARRIFYSSFERHHLDHLRPMAGADDMLAALRDDGFYLGVVSNKQGPLLRKEADHLGWTDYFGSLVGAGDAPRDKPDPAPVALALGSSGVAPGRAVWLVGDTALDMRCAVNAGCVPVLVMGHGRLSDDFTGCAPEREVADCAALLALVRRL